MTNDPLDRVTQTLRDAVADPGDLNALPTGRDAAVVKLREALERRARARRWRRRGAVLALAASTALVVGGFVASQHRLQESRNDLGRVAGVSGGAGVAAVLDGRSVPIDTGARVSEGTELQTPPGSEAQLEYESGTRVTLAGGTRVRLVEQRTSKRFAVQAGAVSAKVAKLGPDERFLVATPDAEVEVRGTAFRVAVVPPDPTCGDGTPTRLDVSEGVVVLRHAGVEERVGTGGHWPDCAAALASAGLVPPTASAPTTARAAATSLPPVAVANANDQRSATAAPTNEPQLVTTAATNELRGATATIGSAETPRPRGTAEVAPRADSELTEQNDLFASAMQNRQAGHQVEAIANLNRLLAKYPRGPLAESATVERFRLLDGAAKAAAARDYLTRWPRGFARNEAEALASRP